MSAHGYQGRKAGVVVAIDGPSGSGKSSTSRGVAQRCGLEYLDTGAMYRAITHWMLEQDVDVSDPNAVAQHVHRPRIAMGRDPQMPTVSVDDRDVAAEIRSEWVTGQVSAVSAVPEVRQRLVADQRSLIDAAVESGNGIVVEGRDITTVVAPHADVKLYLTASTQARASRRSDERQTEDVAATQAALERRDRLDSTRSTSPLTQTEDAVELDTTGYTLAEVIDVVADLVAQVRQHVVARS
ncbi:(d)CMP kinase [Lipingzhangella sp. LS1_29]|uniref:Cytidylate kinase n=1 Tax=Lipingzhangella rawalii TaxID=2055835 RepID=A0ABU2H379_9ACTN|nr:(d)CMP kinase [Lipingzhangella rawalii]MDS1269310.1 (d)CMP kinase [Lipingzhangella rawalii]